MIHDNQDSHALSMACVAARYLGAEHQLAADLAACGFEISASDVLTRGEFFGDAWRVGDDTKTRCHLCCEALPYPGALCGCLQEALPKRHVNVHDTKLLGRLAPETVAYTYLCAECGCFTAATVGQILPVMLRHKGSFRPFRRCSACLEESRTSRPRKAQNRRPNNRPAAQPNAEASGPALQAELDAAAPPPAQA